jgi:RimJ/RimL family protein N-acetyltransferase
MAAPLKPDSDGAERLASSTIRGRRAYCLPRFYMNKEVYIRPLRVEDAQISYQWRNNPKIWRHTLSKPDRHVTVEMEAESLARVLTREDEKRFAICLSDNRAYIGNIFYTDIRDGEAELHIFIGEQRRCGKGRAYDAVCQILDYGFNTLKLETVYALVKEENLAAKALGRRTGFKRKLEYCSDEAGANVVKFVFTKLMYEQKEHLGVGISDVRAPSKNRASCLPRTTHEWSGLCGPTQGRFRG